MGDNGVNGGIDNNGWAFDRSDSYYESDDDEEDNITSGTEQGAFHMVEDDDHLVHVSSSDSEDSDDDDTRDRDDGFCEPEGQVVIRSREIPFPEDKVGIFRARHMKL